MPAPTKLRSQNLFIGPRRADSDLPGFAHRLNAMLREKDLTQSQVAGRMWGYTVDNKGAKVAKGRDRLSVWCSGKSFPSAESLELLAKALGVSVGELAPQEEVRTAAAAPPEVSMVRSAAYPGKTLLQITKLVPHSIARKIDELLEEADKEGMGWTPPDRS
jgi:transcriptional regulator with XRE-family HTH domain